MLELLAFPTLTKIILIIIIGGFMPLSAITFLTVTKRRKQLEFTKALDKMNISTKRSVEETYSVGKFILPVTFATLICGTAISYFLFANSFAGDIKDSLFLTGAFFGQDNQQLVFQSLSVISMAFLGGFLWSARNIIVRLIANDIAPNVYYSAGIRIILASAVALVLSFVIGADSSTNILSFKSSLSAISFLTGMFPERVLTYMINLYKKFVSPDKLNDDTLSLYKVEGISLQHKERLAEVGIDNAQNLATMSLTKLLIETPYGNRQLIDWIGQAKLLCYAKSDIDNLRQAGIRTVFDLIKVNQSPERLQEISDAIGINTPLLPVIYDQVVNDIGIQNLYKFQNGVNSPTFNEKHVELTPTPDTVTTTPKGDFSPDAKG